MSSYTDDGKGVAVSSGMEKEGMGNGVDVEGLKERRESVFIDDVDPSVREEVAEEFVGQLSSIAEHALHVEDDPTLSPWTFRMWFIGIGLSLFSSVLATIYTFKPQQLTVSVIFLAVVSYALGEGMALLIPRKGWIGKWLNPHKFNSKEHTAIIIMSSSAATCALATYTLAAQRLYYPTFPSAGASIFMIFASQMLGYGIAGINRETLVYPRKLVYPSNLPMNTLIETFHRDKKETWARLKFFWIIFAIIFCWETLPQYMMPLLTGISIFCLAKRDSLVFTNIFGGADGNEGLGVLSICFDWQYIGSSCLWFPLQTLFNGFTGYILCIILFCGAYYSNMWRAMDFPFLSQLLFVGDSNTTYFDIFNQSIILTSDNVLNETALADYGVPYFTPTYALAILTNNLAITATIVHMMLWDYEIMMSALSIFSPKKLKEWLTPWKWDWQFWKKSSMRDEADFQNTNFDAHFFLTLKYKDAPDWWYLVIFVISFVIGIVCLYSVDSTLPWWGYIVAIIISYVFILFTGALYGISGFAMPVQSLIQMIGGYLIPGRPLANMYFTLYGYNPVSQAQLLLRDLKLAQYAHLSPRATFTSQMVGTLLGSILNYVMMASITTNQREILLSIEGTNIWSGQVIQSWNSQATAWGALAKYMFSVGGRYQFVSLAVLLGFLVPLPTYALHRLFPKIGFNYFNTALISWYLGYLCVGINSSVPIYFTIAFVTQFYIRKHHAAWYLRYNYILSAALDGGTQVIVFILSFAVQGSSGKSVPFPPYFGNNFQNGNYDFCMQNPAG